MMSLGALLTVAERLAGVVALSGRVRAHALRGERRRRRRLRRVPVLVAHGLHDDVLPVDARARRARCARARAR